MHNEFKTLLRNNLKTPVILILLMFLSCFITSGYSSLPKVSQTSTQFSFTGNYSFKNEDLNGDGYGDILIFSMEVQVTSPGLVQFTEICAPDVTFKNATSSLTVQQPITCFIGSYVIDLSAIGITIISVWFGYQTIFSALGNSSNNGFTSAVLNLQFQFYSYYSNNTINDSTITSPAYSLTDNQIQNISLKSTGVGVANSFNSFPIKSLIYNRSLSEVYYFREDVLSVDQNIKSTVYENFTFLELNSSSICYNIYGINSNGTFRFNNTYYITNNNYNITNNPSFASPMFIPKNESSSNLQFLFNNIWTSFAYSDASILGGQVSEKPQINISYFSSGQIFSTHLNDYINNSVVTTSSTFDVTYNLTTGFLTYYKFIKSINSTILINHTLQSISSIPTLEIGNTSMVSTSNQNTVQSTGVNSNGKSSNPEIKSTFFLNNPLYIVIPFIILSVLIVRKRKK